MRNSLDSVIKPGRYIGNEWNSIHKDHSSVDVKIALCFPDIYEVGMSHLGLKLLYSLLNQREDVACERVFAPWMDMERVMRDKSIPLSSLETHTHLNQFDIVGFSLQYEMSYTNVLNMLDLGGIPKESSLREGLPLVMGGGPCTLNPESIADFFDIFFIGEAEEAFLEIVDIFKGVRASQGKGEVSHREKEELLFHLAKVQGVYIPSFYNVGYEPCGKVKDITPRYGWLPEKIKKRTVLDLDNAHYPTKPVVPFIQIIHDRIGLEVMRGCPSKCRFCQATSIYSPRRERSMDKLLNLAKETFANTGYEELSLLSLSTGDYSNIMELISRLHETFKGKGVKISLPSLRASSIMKGLETILKFTKGGTITFAPEAGTERLREVINKRLKTEELLKTVKLIYQAGRRNIKLYFMLGLPTEECEDIDGIAELILNVSSMRKELDGKWGGVTVSVSSFIPKPHTPFQWARMETIDALTGKQEYLKTSIRKNRWVKMDFHEPRLSFLEGVFSRGDRRLSSVLKRGWEMGCRFDGWTEHFNFQLWQEAFKQTGLDPDFYALRERDIREVLPWSHIDCGVPDEFLKKEWVAVEANKPQHVLRRPASR